MSPRFEKLIIHVGDMKTGTTSIQAALAARNVPDVGLSVVYPGGALNHNELAQALANPAGTEIRPRIAKLREMIEKAPDGDICIISAENLCDGSPAVIAKEIDRWLSDLARDVTVIHYVRPHFGYLTSRYIEAVKTGTSVGSFDAWTAMMIEKDMHKAAPRVDEWRGAMQGRYIARAFVRSELVRGDAVADFFTQVLGPLPDQWTAPKGNNEALPVEALDALMELQSKFCRLPQVFRSAFGRHFAMVYSDMFGGRPATKLMPSAELAETIHAACADDADRLDRELSSGSALFRNDLDSCLESSGDASAYSGKPLTTDELAELSGRLFAEMAEALGAKECGAALHSRRSARLVGMASGHD
jgi:hypothetical protein